MYLFGLSFILFLFKLSYGLWSDIEVVKFPETGQCDWLLRKILSVKVCDVKVDLVGKVICRVKLFDKRYPRICPDFCCIL